LQLNDIGLPETVGSYGFMKPPAHKPFTRWQIESTRLASHERHLFFDNLDLLLTNEQAILSVDEYFFCRPIFATYGVYFSRPIVLGTLLLGWRDGILRDYCCTKLGQRSDGYTSGGTSHVYFFGGISSGTKSAGYCTTCGSLHTVNRHLIFERMAFQEQCRDWTEVLQLEHYPAFKFSFGEPARVPTTEAKMRKLKAPLIKAMSVAELINELLAGNPREATASDRRLLPEHVLVKNGDRSGLKKIKLFA